MKFFEKYLREKVIKAETPLNTLDLWQAIERKRKKRRRLLFFWWFFGVTIGLSGLSFAVFKWQENKALAIALQKANETVFCERNKENNSDVKNNINNSLSDNNMNKKQPDIAFSSINFADEKDIIKVKNTTESAVKGTQNNDVVIAQKTIETTNVVIENQAIFNSKNQEENTNKSQEKAVQIESISQEKQVFLQKEKEKTIDLLPILPLSSLKETTDKKLELPFVSFLKKTTIKYKNELLFSGGAGSANRNTTNNSDVKQVGTIKGLVAWNGNVSFRHHFDNQYFIETGVQLNQIVNFLTHKNTTTTTLFYPDSLKRIALNTVTGEPYIAKDTFKVFRTIERQVHYYQYFTNINLLIGGGKSWTKNRFKYQLGANAALMIFQKNKGIYLDKDELSKNLEKTKGINLSMNVYAQANYQISKTNQLFAKISYWQYLQPLEKDTKYGITNLSVGYLKRF